MRVRSSQRVLLRTRHDQKRPKLTAFSLGAVVLHVLDDNFIQPQSGTSAFDHLASGLVPSAVLLTLAAVGDRLRPGLQASLVALAGIFGVVAGSEALYYANNGGMSGDDYTGLLALAAGLLLIVAAVSLLWRSRRKDGSLTRRSVRRVLVAGAVAVTGFLIIIPFFEAQVLTHVARGFVPRPQLGAPYENVSFKTADGLRLRGWYVPSRNGAAVISFPGRKGTQKPARMLARHGYGVLLFDRRGEGESDGDPNAWGWSGYRDVDAAVRYLRTRQDVDPDRIGGIGLSVGGEMMLEAASRSRGLRAVISEGAGERSINEFLEMTVGNKWLALPQYASLTIGTALFSRKTPPPSLKDIVDDIAPTPVLFI